MIQTELLAWYRAARQTAVLRHQFSVSAGTACSRTCSTWKLDAGHDRYRDLGADLEYQGLSGGHDVTFLAWISEGQLLTASQQLALAENRWNRLWTATLTGSYLFDRTYGTNVQYFQTGGTKDATLCDDRTGRPGRNGWIFQLNYLPFNKRGGPSFWPYSNAKLSLQYTLHQTFDGAHHDFDGTGRNTSDNNTLYLEAWIDF